MALARKLQPDAISLDLGLSDIDGFVLLDLLKHDPMTSHLPIHVVSGSDKVAKALELGADGVTEKPAERADLARVFTGLAKGFKTAKRPKKKLEDVEMGQDPDRR